MIEANFANTYLIAVIVSVIIGLGTVYIFDQKDIPKKRNGKKKK